MARRIPRKWRCAPPSLGCKRWRSRITTGSTARCGSPTPRARTACTPSWAWKPAWPGAVTSPCWRATGRATPTSAGSPPRPITTGPRDRRSSTSKPWHGTRKGLWGCRAVCGARFRPRRGAARNARPSRQRGPTPRCSSPTASFSSFRTIAWRRNIWPTPDCWMSRGTPACRWWPPTTSTTTTAPVRDCKTCWFASSTPPRSKRRGGGCGPIKSSR